MRCGGGGVYPKPMRARARACVREVTSVRSRVDRTRRNVRDVRVPNARVRVCGTAVEDASSRIDATTRDVVDRARGRTLARVGRPHGPTVGPGRAVGRGLVRESRPVKRQTDTPPRAIDPPRDRARPDRPSRSGRGGTRWVVVVSLVVEMCVHPSRARVRWCANKYIDEGSRPVRDHPLHRVVCSNV